MLVDQPKLSKKLTLNLERLQYQLALYCALHQAERIFCSIEISKRKDKAPQLEFFFATSVEYNYHANRNHVTIISFVPSTTWFPL